jgi:hypothetical protein
MDIQQLCGALQACMSPNMQERQSAEAALKQVHNFNHYESDERKPRAFTAYFEHPLNTFFIRHRLLSIWTDESVHRPQNELSKGHIVNLLRVAAEESVDPAVRQVAAITFKNTAKRNWEGQDGA